IVAFLVIRADDPAFAFLFAGFLNERPQVGFSGSRIREYVAELKRIRSIQTVHHLGRRSIGDFSHPKKFAVFFEQLNWNTSEPALQVVIGTVPNGDPIDLLKCFQIKLPPWIGRSLGMSCGFFIKVAVCISIDGQARRTIERSGALGCLALWRDIRAALINLDFSQGENFVRARELEADVADGWTIGRRSN